MSPPFLAHEPNTSLIIFFFFILWRWNWNVSHCMWKNFFPSSFSSSAEWLVTRRQHGIIRIILRMGWKGVKDGRRKGSGGQNYPTSIISGQVKRDWRKWEARMNEFHEHWNYKLLWCESHPTNVKNEWTINWFIEAHQTSHLTHAQRTTTQVHFFLCNFTQKSPFKAWNIFIFIRSRILLGFFMRVTQMKDAEWWRWGWRVCGYT